MDKYKSFEQLLHEDAQHPVMELANAVPATHKQLTTLQEVMGRKFSTSYEAPRKERKVA